MKCHERWIDLLASVASAFPELSEQVERLISACEARVEDGLIDFELIEHALIELYQESGDEFFGWKAGWSLCLRTQLHRTVTVYTDLQATLGDALMVTQDYPELLVMPGMKYVPRPTLKTIRIHMRSNGYEFKNFGQIAMLCMAAILKSGRDSAKELDLTELVVDPKLLDEKLLSEYTKGVIRGESNQFSLATKLSWLKHPKPTADALLAESIKPILDKEVLKLRREEGLIDQIEKALYQTDHPQQFTLKEFSSQVGMSEASIRRKLSEKKVGFSDLIQNFLRTSAIQHLIDEEETVDSVTFRLGFSERAAFERAFKRWYGLSPAQFREKFLAMAELEDSSHSSLAEIEVAPLPKVVQEALVYMDSPDYSVPGLATIIKTDMIFSARLMSTANSAFYGAGKVRDLEDAIGRVLGLNRVRNMTLTLAVKDVFSGLDSDFDMRRLWFVSMFAEKWLEKLRRNINWTFDLPYNDFVSSIQFGLIGHLLIAQSDLPQRSEWLTVIQEPSLEEIVRWEKTNLGMSVFTISALLLARWGMSSNICKFLISISPHLFDKEDTLCMPGAALLISSLAWEGYLNVEVEESRFTALASALNMEPDLLLESYNQVIEDKEELEAMLKQVF